MSMMSGADFSQLPLELKAKIVREADEQTLYAWWRTSRESRFLVEDYIVSCLKRNRDTRVLYHLSAGSPRVWSEIPQNPNADTNDAQQVMRDMVTRITRFMTLAEWVQDILRQAGGTAAVQPNLCILINSVSLVNQLHFGGRRLFLKPSGTVSGVEEVHPPGIQPPARAYRFPREWLDGMNLTTYNLHRLRHPPDAWTDIAGNP